MRKQILFAIILFISVFAFCGFGASYHEDTLAIRKILDFNGDSSTSATSVSSKVGDRVDALNLRYKDTLLAEIGVLTALSELNLSGYKASAFPPEMAALTNLKRLDLSNSDIDSLQPFIPYFDQLTFLNLSYCDKIFKLPGDIGNLGLLDSLNLSYTSITQLPSDFGSLTSLKYLTLKMSPFFQFSAEIAGCTALEVLDIEYTKLLTLPDEFGNLTNLKRIYAKNGILETFPATISGLKKLTYLDIKNNQITSLPDSIGGLSSLDTLLFTENPIEYLPDGFGNLSSLQFLDLSKNSLKTLPTTIGGLNSLKRIELNYNPLTSLPDSIGGLDSLIWFEADVCSLLTSLPEGFGGLKQLKTIRMMRSGLESLPESFGTLSELDSAIFYDNNIQSLPLSLKYLPKIRYLDLAYNEIVDGYEIFKDMNSLEFLRISNNKLQNLGFGVSIKYLEASDNEIDSLVLPNSGVIEELRIKNNKIKSLDWYDFVRFDRLIRADLSNNELTRAFAGYLGNNNYTQLKTLNFSHNNIDRIWDDLSKLTTVESLSVSFNPLDSLPASISAMPNLKRLGLAGLPNMKFTDTIFSIDTLDFLDLSYNEFSTLPAAISKMEMVWGINLSNNNFTEFPDEIKNISIVWLEINDNKLSTLPDSLFAIPMDEDTSTIGWFEASKNEITSIPNDFHKIPNIRSIDFSQNLLEDLPDSIIHMLQGSDSWNKNFSYNRLCDSVSDTLYSWLNPDSEWGVNLYTQDCEIPENPFSLTGIERNDSIFLHWDTLSYDDSSDHEFSRILYSNTGFPILAQDTESSVLGDYDVYSIYDDTLLGVPHKRYYFSLFIRDLRGWWSDTTSSAQTVISTHELILKDSSGNNSVLTASPADSPNGIVEVYYKLYNTDSEDNYATTKLYFRNGLSASWDTAAALVGDINIVPSNDSTSVYKVSWNALAQLGNDFVSDSIEIMITASAQFNKADSIKGVVAVDFTTIPISPTNLLANPSSKKKIDLTWTKSISTDVKNQFLCYNTNGEYPTFPDSAEKVIQLNADVESFSFDSLHEKKWYFFSILAEDSAGNRTLVDSSSTDSARTFDITAPDNIKSLTIEELAQDSVSFKWLSMDSIDAESILVVLSIDTVKALADTFAGEWSLLTSQETSISFNSLIASTKYYVGFFVSDSVGNWSTGAFKSFSTSKLGNKLSSITLAEIVTEQSGDVTLSFTIDDPDMDSLDVSFKYCVDGVNWLPATMSGKVSGYSFAEYSGITLNAIWQSKMDIDSLSTDSLLLAAVPFDPAKGVEDTIVVKVDNYHLQSMVLNLIPGQSGGDIKIQALHSDTSSDSSSLTYFFSIDFGSTWEQTTYVTNILDTLIWHSSIQFPNSNITSVMFKAVPNDGWQDGIAGITDTFSINNQTTFITGDYNQDSKVDFLDFSYVASYWNLSANGIKDPEVLDELAPSTGDAPYLTVTPDSLYNYEDLAAFVKMYYWSKNNIDSSSRIEVNRSLGEETDFVISNDDSTVTLDLTFTGLEDIVAMRYLIRYDDKDLKCVSTDEGEFLKRGGADLLTVRNSTAGIYKENSARISSNDLSASGNGSFGSITFKRLLEGHTSLTVEYELINSQHKVVTSGREHIDINAVSQNSSILEIVPSISTVEEAIILPNSDEKITVDQASWKRESGFNIYIDIPDTLAGEDLSGTIKIFDFLGNLVLESNFSGSIEEFTEPFVLQWSGHNELGEPLSSGAYIVLLRYHSGTESQIFKKFIGIKKKY